MQKGDIMELQVLLSRLENAGYHPQISGNRDSNCDMIHIRILTEGQRHFEETTLYLTSTGLMPEADNRQIFTLFCYGAVSYTHLTLPTILLV